LTCTYFSSRNVPQIILERSSVTNHLIKGIPNHQFIAKVSLPETLIDKQAQLRGSILIPCSNLTELIKDHHLISLRLVLLKLVQEMFSSKPRGR